MKNLKISKPFCFCEMFNHLKIGQSASKIPLCFAFVNDSSSTFQVSMRIIFVYPLTGDFVCKVIG